MFIIFEFMYLFNSCMNSCIYYFFEYMYLLFLTIKLFLCFYSLLFLDMFMLYPFYDLMIFIYNPKELKLSPRKQYK